MRLIFSNSVLSILFKIIFLMPLLLIIKIIKDPGSVYLCAILILFFQSSILFLFNMLYGVIILKDDKLHIPNDLQIIKALRMQHRITIHIKDIVALEFATEECNSIGENINFRYIGDVPYLKLYMKDGAVKRIHLCKFSFRTWEKIELLLLKGNNEILIMRNAKTFIKYLKIGTLKK